MTVEAAFVLPLFVFFSLAILAPIQWMDTQRKVQTVVEQFGEDLSQYAYVLDRFQGDEEMQQVEEEEWSYIKAVFSDAAAGIWLEGKVSELADRIVITEVQVPDEHGDIFLSLEYKENIPFFTGGMGNITMKAAAKRRSWIGIDGKLKEQGTNGDDDNGEQEMVYVAQRMGRYHRYRDCPYISNELKAVTIQELDHYRNPDGKIYYACEVCCKDGEKPENNTGTQHIVYIADWGKRYHTSTECKSISSYLRKVPLAEVEYLGECSVCAGRRYGNTKME